MRDGKKKVHPFGKRKKILFITKTNKKLKKEKTRGWTTYIIDLELFGLNYYVVMCRYRANIMWWGHGFENWNKVSP